MQLVGLTQFGLDRMPRRRTFALSSPEAHTAYIISQHTPQHTASGPTLSMFEVFGRTGPPTLGGRHFGP